MVEVFLPFKNSPIRPIEEVRSTLIMAGLQTLRAHGLFARYSEVLSPDSRERILGLAAGVWVPVDVAVAHYGAVDRLALDPRIIESIGAEVAERSGKHILSKVFSRAKRIGSKPWESLAFTHQTIEFNWRGGDVRIFKEGPRMALYEWAGQPCARIPYFVTSFGAFMRALMTLFSFQSYHRIVPERCSRTTIAVRLSWTNNATERLIEGTPEARNSEKPKGLEIDAEALTADSVGRGRP
jgi:hypothetical protein